MRKWIVILVLIVVGVIAYNYIYQNHRDIESETAEFIVRATDLTNEFVINPSAAEKKYLNQTIEVFGSITELNDYNLTLDGKIFCQFSSKIEFENKNAKIKGRFIGYDNLLEQVKIDQCNILTN